MDLRFYDSPRRDSAVVSCRRNVADELFLRSCLKNRLTVVRLMSRRVYRDLNYPERWVRLPAERQRLFDCLFVDTPAERLIRCRQPPHLSCCSAGSLSARSDSRLEGIAGIHLLRNLALRLRMRSDCLFPAFGNGSIIMVADVPYAAD